MPEDRTCLSYWFPKIEAAGLPVPRTKIVRMPGDTLMEFYKVFDGERPGPAADNFCDLLKITCDSMGYPCFLRTGQTSGKHDWDRTCFVQSPERIRSHVIALIEYSELADFMGLACDVWAVREFLPTRPVAVCKNWNGMPVCREFRVFAEEGQARCWHPYWPAAALEEGGADVADYDALCELRHAETVFNIAESATMALGGAWSVDVLDTARGWYLTDMAEAHKSFHWPDCPHAGEHAPKEQP